MRGLSTFWFNSEIEISPESICIWCSGGLYLQTLPVVLPGCPSPQMLVPGLGCRHCTMEGSRTHPCCHWEQFWKGSPVSSNLQEFYRFPHHTNLVIGGSHSKIFHLNRRPEFHKIKTSWSKLTSSASVTWFYVKAHIYLLFYYTNLYIIPIFIYYTNYTNLAIFMLHYIVFNIQSLFIIRYI